MEILRPAWHAADYCLNAEGTPRKPILAALAHAVYRKACRSDLNSPGFCLIDLGPSASSLELRRAMRDLVNELRPIHTASTGRRLACLSAGRFDQQVTTKIHRDAAPDESLLLLGYEASPIESEVALADYSRCSYDRGLTPQQFLDRYNPMFVVGEKMLEPYTTCVRCFSNRRFQILAINNSLTRSDSGLWQGVLHTATVFNPNDAQQRVVNSIMLTSLPKGASDVVSDAELEVFATSQTVHRRGYDKTHLEET